MCFQAPTFRQSHKKISKKWVAKMALRQALLPKIV